MPRWLHFTSKKAYLSLVNDAPKTLTDALDELNQKLFGPNKEAFEKTQEGYDAEQRELLERHRRVTQDLINDALDRLTFFGGDRLSFFDQAHAITQARREEVDRELHEALVEARERSLPVASSRNFHTITLGCGEESNREPNLHRNKTMGRHLILACVFLLVCLSSRASAVDDGGPPEVVKTAASGTPAKQGEQSATEIIKDLVQIVFWLTVSIVTILTYRRARHTLLQPIRTEVFIY